VKISSRQLFALWFSVAVRVLFWDTIVRTPCATASNSSVQAEEDKIAEEVVDPTALLAQVRFLDFYSPGNFHTSAQTNAALIQPIIPIARLSLMPFEQLIRLTFRVNTFATGPNSHPNTALADTQMYHLFQSQWPNLKRWNLRWAVGYMLIFPTAADHRAGQNAWQAGPAAALAFAGIPNLWAGFLFQNPISFEYTRPSAHPQNTMFFQPGLSYRLGHGWYVKSTDSVWNVHWRHGTPTTIPVSLGIGKIWILHGQMLDTWTSGEWMAYRQDAGISPMYTVRFGLNFVFPSFVLGH
jgi:hypothetical protein